MKTTMIGAFEAKTHFSELLTKVHEGTLFIVTKHGKPVAQLGPADSSGIHPVFGSARGRVHIANDFDTPLSDFEEYES
ncbi:MAG: type II toxin-antitoxin system Phd/YefM family antitoxin [bacterium]